MITPILPDNSSLIKLQVTKGVPRFAIVDQADFDYLNQWAWRLSNNGYAVRTAYPAGKKGKTTTIRMHRIILSAPTGLEVDHLNHNKLDNRRCNLSVTTKAENLASRRRAGAVRGIRCLRIQASANDIRRFKEQVYKRGFPSPEAYLQYLLDLDSAF